MNSSTVLIFLICALLAGIPLNAHTLENVRLTYDEGASENARLAIDPEGNRIVVWQDERFGNKEILWRKFTPAGDPLTDIVRITETPDASTRPDVDCDATGVSHIVWQEVIGYVDHVYFCRLDQGGSKILYDTDVMDFSVSPRVSARPAGGSDVVWYRSTTDYQHVYHRRYDAGGSETCSPPGFYAGTLLPWEKTPVITTTDDGTAWILWSDIGQWFDECICLGTIDSDCQTVDIAAYTHDNVIHPTVDSYGNEPWALFELNGDIYDLLSPGSACDITEGSGTSTHPTVAVDVDRCFAAWEDTRDGNSEIYYCEFVECENLTGDVPITVDSAWSLVPDIAVNAAVPGDWAVVWHDDRDGNFEIYMTAETAPSPPSPPSDLVATTQGPDSVLLTWQDNSISESGFEVERRTEWPGSWGVVQSVPAGTTQWDDSNVVEGVQYYYRVRAWNSYGYSPYSNLQSAVPSDVPSPPTDLTATAVSAVRVDLSWTDNSGNEAGFHVQRWKTGVPSSLIDLAPNPGANSEAYRDLGLQPSSEYGYRVRAYNQTAHSEWSEIAVAVTPALPGEFDADIVVRFGAELVEGAEVFVASGSGFVKQPGTTDADGRLSLAGLALGDMLRAQKRVAEREAVKPGHGAVDDLMWELWLDSDRLLLSSPETAIYAPVIIDVQQLEYRASLAHPIFKYNLVVVVERDLPPDDALWDDLEAGFRSASNYLYNVSDGQVMLGSVAVYDDKGWRWRFADLQIVPTYYPNAHVDGIYWPVSWCGRIRMGETWGGAGPVSATYFRTIIHEFGHYALGLYDEYRDGNGEDADWETYRDSNPDECLSSLSSYGFMDSQYSATENSSANDYLRQYPAEPEPETVTTQYYERHMSCWDWVEQRLESFYAGINVVKPVHGWYPDGLRHDRSGPSDDVGLAEDWWLPHNEGSLVAPPMEFHRFDCGPGSYSIDLVVLAGGHPAAAADVYKLGSAGVAYLGRTPVDGRLRLVGVKEGDEIRVYHRAPLGATSSGLLLSQAILESGGASLDVGFTLRGRSVNPDTRGDDLRSPGAAVDATPSGSVEAPVVRLDIWPDEALEEDPLVIGFYGITTDTLVVTAVPGEDRYSAELEIDTADTLFAGDGLFEITMSDTSGNASTFVTDFVLYPTAPSERLELHTAAASLDVKGEDISAEQLALAARSNTVPFAPVGFGPVPVTDVLSFHLADEDAFATGGGLNAAYAESLLAGIDETSLSLFRWDAGALSWDAVDGSLVSTPRNMVSALVDEGGVFCVFATSVSTDDVPPARVSDLGAVGALGQGTVELDWTAPGDDAMIGTALEYVIAFSDSTITETSWSVLPTLPGSVSPSPAGSHEVLAMSLPEPGHLYYIALRAKDEAGNLAPLSNVTYAVSGVADPNFLPGPPGDIRAVDAPADTGGAVLLTWERSYDDGGGKNTVEQYRIYRSEPPSAIPAEYATAPAGTTAFVDAYAVDGVKYVYWVSAADSVQETFGLDNEAFSARNVDVPMGDFTSDGAVGVDDFGWLVDTYGIDAGNLEYDPLFDLDANGDIHTGDFDLFESGFGEGGLPGTEPPGQNDGAIVFYTTAPAESSRWHVTIRTGNARNLAGYSLLVTYPTGTLELVDVTPDTSLVGGNILNRHGALTPLFLASEPSPGTLLLANAIKRPTADMSPEGSGLLAQVTFSGTGADEVVVSDIVLVDHERLMNYQPLATLVDEGEVVLRPRLFQNYPNPFNATTMLSFQIPKESQVSLKVYNLQGRLVRTLADGAFEAGPHRVVWNGRSEAGHSVASGVYFYRLKTSGYEKTRKMVLLK